MTDCSVVEQADFDNARCADPLRLRLGVFDDDLQGCVFLGLKPSGLARFGDCRINPFPWREDVGLLAHAVGDALVAAPTEGDQVDSDFFLPTGMKVVGWTCVDVVALKVPKSVMSQLFLGDATPFAGVVIKGELFLP